MKLFDISRPLTPETAVYKNKPEKRFVNTVIATHAANGAYESEMKTNMHTGTHVDAPIHQVDGGAFLGEIDLSLYYGPCEVYDLTAVEEAIRRSDLEKLDIPADIIVLFKTSNSHDAGWNSDFVYLAPDAAQYLVDRGVRTVGLDAMSIERNSPDHETHRILLEAGLGLIEDVRLAEIEPGRYTLSCLPLSIPGAEAAPARAVLIR